MEETRASLQDKLEVLEQQVINTVQDANQTVVTVKETVEAVKETVQGTAETVKETIQGTVDSVKDTLSLDRQVREHPWAMLAGAAAVGFLGERLIQRWTAVPSQPLAQPAPVFTPPAYASPRKKSNGAVAMTPPAEPAPSLWNTVLATYSSEIDKLKKLAVSAVGGVARELVAESAPPALAEGIKDIVDSVTAKLGGTPLEGPILNMDARQAAYSRKAS